MLIVGSVVLLYVPALAQVSRPVLGYLPDGGRIRPVYGLPASAAVGSAFDQGRDLARIAVSPGQDYVLATAADTSEALLIAPGGPAVHLDGVAAGADRIVMSPGGSAAALWFSATSHLQIVSGLPSAPSVLDIDAAFRGAAPDALAVSDDGQWLVGAWPDGVYALGAAGQVNRLPLNVNVSDAGGASALAFFHRRQDLAIATPTVILTITDVGGSAVPTVVYDSTASPLSPLAIAMSFDNRRLAEADRAGSVLSVDLSSGVPASFDCGCTPEGLFAMGGSVFRLTGLAPGVVKLFDAATGDVLFVPPAMAVGEQQ
jgi:hypothetical protein